MKNQTKTEKGHLVFKCFKEFENNEPEYAKTKTDEIYDEIYDNANVTQEEWNDAVGRVCFDGYYGPVTNEEYAEANSDSKVTSLREALKIVRTGMKTTIQDIKFYNPDYPSDYVLSEEEIEEGQVEEPNCVIDGSTIKKEIFWFYHEIYG